MKKTFVYDQQGRVVEETVVLDDTDIRLRLLEMTKTDKGFIYPQMAFEAEHYVRSGKLMPYSQLNKAIKESQAHD